MHEALYGECVPIVVGDRAPLADAMRRVGLDARIHAVDRAADALGVPGTIDLINLGLIGEGGWHYKEVSAQTGEAAFRYVERAIRLAIAGEVDAVATGPIGKEAIHLAGHNYSGHTEIFADYTGTKAYAMLLASQNLRVIHVTTHVAPEEACRRIVKERVLKTIELEYFSMRLLGVARPHVGVAGLNPHSSENGLFGHQEV